MKRGVKQERAITLITLVITIIVLIIIAAISIVILMGEDGLIKKAEIAKEEAKKAEYEEIFKTIMLNLKADKVIEQLSAKEYIDRFQDIIEDKDELDNAIITRKDDETIRVEVKEGYVYEITEDKIEFIGKRGENPPPTLQESDIEFEMIPSEWTNHEVEVRIKTKIEGYTTQYSKNGTDWNNYTSPITMTDNGAIYARLVNNLDEAGGYATGNVENIDKLEPNQFIPTVATTTNSIILSGTATDVAKTVTDGCSGIDKYYFSNDNGSTWLPTEGQTSNSYTFSGLIQNKTYNLKMKVVDTAGNERITDTVSRATGTVPTLTSSNVTFSYNPSDWTKENVSVSISTTITGYTLQYSTNNSTWNNYSSAVTMTSNGSIYARLMDSTGQVGEYATGNVTKIDRTGPTVSVSAGNVTTNSAKLTVSASDGQSGLATSGTYKYYLGSSLVSTSTSNSYTYGSLLGGTSYTLKVIVTDKVGNTTEKSVNITTKGPKGAVTIGDGIIRDTNNNEWVWIEVPKSIYPSSTTKTSYSAIESAMQTYASTYRLSNWADTFYSSNQHGFANATEYNNLKNSMLSSVFENGGFYIGRYEMGTSTARFVSTDALTKPLIQRDKYPYNFITCSQAQTLSKQLSTGGKQTSLMFGIQWDLVLKFVEEKGYLQDGTKVTQSMLKSNSSIWGNYENATFDVKRSQGLYTITPTISGSWNTTSNYTKPSSKVLLTTGATDRNNVLGIYDLAGNVYEWTLEKTSFTDAPCAGRGGSCYNNGASGYPASYRHYDDALTSYISVGCRPALW